MSGGGVTGPNKLLLVLMGVVPLVVLVALGVSFLLVRVAGFGLLAGAGVPFLVATLFIVGLSVALGRAAGGSSDGSGDGDGV